MNLIELALFKLAEKGQISIEQAREINELYGKRNPAIWNLLDALIDRAEKKH